MKTILKEIFEIDNLLKEFKRKKEEHLAALRDAGTPQEALVRIASELHELQKNIHAKDPYTNPRRFINWN